MKEGRKPEYPEKTPGDERQKMPKDSSPKRDSNPHTCIGGWLESRRARSRLILAAILVVYADDVT